MGHWHVFNLKTHPSTAFKNRKKRKIKRRDKICYVIHKFPTAKFSRSRALQTLFERATEHKQHVKQRFRRTLPEAGSAPQRAPPSLREPLLLEQPALAG